MIVVIFVSARAHVRYLRCSLIIYASCGQFCNVTASAVCAPLKTTFYRYLSLHLSRSLSITPAVFFALFLFPLLLLPYSSLTLALPLLLACLLTPSISHWSAHTSLYCIHLLICGIFANVILCYFLLSPFPCSVCCPSVWQHGLQAREKLRTSHHAKQWRSAVFSLHLIQVLQCPHQYLHSTFI